MDKKNNLGNLKVFLKFENNEIHLIKLTLQLKKNILKYCSISPECLI